MAEVEQSKTQRTGPIMRSPRNGAECRVLGPGQSGNPRGSSLKQRSQAALAKILDDQNLEAAFIRLAKIAKESDDDGNAVAALRLIADVTGLKIPDLDASAPVLLVHRVVFEDRDDGEDAKFQQLQPPTGTDGPAIEAE